MASSLLLSWPKDLALAAWIFLLSGALGEAWLGLAPADKKSPCAERSAWAIMLGYGTLMFSLWFLAWLGLLKNTLIVSMMITATVLLHKKLAAFGQIARQGLRDCRDKIRQERLQNKGLFFILILLAALLAGQQILSNHTPPTEEDDLSYHLYLPKMHLAQQGLSDPVYPQYQSYLSHMTEMVFIAPLACGSELAAKALNFLWGLMLPLLIFTLAQRLRLSTCVGFIAGIIAYATPMVLHLGETAMPDLPIACFILGGLLALLAFHEEKQNSYLVIAAGLTALGMTKYTAWAYGLANAALFAFLHWRQKKQCAQGLALFAAAGAIAIAPHAFYVWNLTGSPLYPIYGVPALPFDPIQHQIQQYFQSQAKDIRALAEFLWRDWPNARFLNDTPFIILAPLIVFYREGRKGALGLIGAWSLLGFFIRFICFGPAGALTRYLLPSHAVWILLAAWVWERAGRESPWQNLSLKTLIVAQLLVPSVFASTLRAFAPLKLHLGLTSKTQFLEQHYHREGWAMVHYINNLPGASKIAVLDHHFMPYYYKNLGAGLWPMPYWLMLAENPSAIKTALQKEGVTHVLFVRAQWRHGANSEGHIFTAWHLGSYVQCRWWRQGKPLPFLQAEFQTPGATLFRVAAPATKQAQWRHSRQE